MKRIFLMIFILGIIFSGNSFAQWQPESFDKQGMNPKISGVPGTLQFTLKHTNVVDAVQWSPDGSKIATASSDSTAIIWSATSGAKLFTLRGHIEKVLILVEIKKEGTLRKKQ